MGVFRLFQVRSWDPHFKTISAPETLPLMSKPLFYQFFFKMLQKIIWKLRQIIANSHKFSEISAQETPFLSLWSAPKPHILLIGAAPPGGTYAYQMKKVKSHYKCSFTRLQTFRCFLHADLKGHLFPVLGSGWREKKLKEVVNEAYRLPGGHLDSSLCSACQ